MLAVIKTTMHMFNNDFYPTPQNVIEMMTAGLDLAGKTVLEPSAGSGNILDFLKNLGAKTIACEKHPDLARIAASKADRFLKNDFFRVRGYKKGTMHFEFVDEDVWMEFNLRVAKIKGWALPKKTDSKRNGTERTKAKAVEVYS
jgi:hypothetical protein